MKWSRWAFVAVTFAFAVIPQTGYAVIMGNSPVAADTNKIGAEIFMSLARIMGALSTLEAGDASAAKGTFDKESANLDSLANQYKDVAAKYFSGDVKVSALNKDLQDNLQFYGLQNLATQQEVGKQVAAEIAGMAATLKKASASLGGGSKPDEKARLEIQAIYSAMDRLLYIGLSTSQLLSNSAQ